MNANAARHTDSEDAVTTRRLSALAHPVRLAILRQLADNDACCVKDVVARVGLAQSTVSQHLKILVEAGLVSCRPNRQSSCYRLERGTLATLADDICNVLRCCCDGTSCFEKD